MNQIYKNYFQIINKYLGIENAISIRFSDTKSEKYKKYQDTACTAILRSLKKDTCTYIDRNNGQLCPGGNYFLDISHPDKKEICDTYVKREKVFRENKVCEAFINTMPKYPQAAKKKYILFTPLSHEIKKSDVIMLLVNPAQTGRILGLSVYKKMSLPSVMPALSTCAAIYAPLVSNQIHLNFIDYFDRYFQGKQKGKLLWKEHQMLISMPFGIFEEITQSIPLSSHGSYKPDLKPQAIDKL